MTTSHAMFVEGQSVTRPPMFSGSNYVSWKERMIIFLQSIDIELWFIVSEGPHEANFLDADTGLLRPKTRVEMNAQDRTNLTLNAKAMNVIYSALDSNESIRVKGCKSAKEMWDKLREIHEGGDNVKEQKKAILVTKYESFKIEPLEDIDKMYCRFTDLIKDLEALGKEYTLGEKNRKILNALGKEWENKVTAIEEAKDLSSVPIESIINSLTSYELKLKSKVQEEEDARAKRNIALKTTQGEDDTAHLDDEDSDGDDNDLALITRGFKRILNKRKFRRGGSSNQFQNQPSIAKYKGKQDFNKKQLDKCFECGQIGHYANECPMKKMKDGKADRKPRFNNFQITWNECNSEGEVEEEEESAQMAFMAIGNNEVTSTHSQSESDNDEDDDLESFVEKLHNALKESYDKNKQLKQKMAFLIQENASLFQQNKQLKTDNESLVRAGCNVQDELDRKTNICEMLKERQGDLKKRMDNLDETLKARKQEFSKRNMLFTHPTTFQRTFAHNKIAHGFTTYRRGGLRYIKPVHVKDSSIMCGFCCQRGHLKGNCYVKRNLNKGMKCMWLVRYNANYYGPKN